MRLVLTVAFVVIAGSATAKEAHCMARLLADVPAEEAPEEIKSKTNGEFGPITQIKINRQTGRMIYCAKDTYCYWSNAFEIISPCRIKRDESNSTSAYFSYFTR